MRKKAISVFILFLAIVFFAPLELIAQVTVPLERDRVLPRQIDPSSIKNEISVVNTYSLTVQKDLPRIPVIRRLDNGYFFTAWEELFTNHKSAGVGTLWADNMQSTGHSVYYTEHTAQLFIGKNEVIPFSDGNILVVYANKLDHKIRFVIFSSAMRIIKGPVLLNGGAEAEIFSATRLSGGRSALIAYFAPSGTAGSGNGKYEILNSAGDIITTGKQFNSGNRLDDVCVVTLPNGLVLFAYRSGFGKSVVMDQTGNIIRTEVTFYPNAVSNIEVVPLSNGNTLIAFIDYQYKPGYVIIDAAGKPLSPPVSMFDGSATTVRATGLANGNILMACNNAGASSGVSLGLLVVDQTGKIVKPLKWFLEGLGTEKNFDMTAVREDLALIVYGGYWPQGSGQTGYKNGFLLVK